jgi:hypothetical protein
MINIPNPNASPYLPMFVAGPGETDVFMIVVVLILITVVMLVGVLYFSLHALPERMAHGADRMKLQFIGILTLIAMFTHNNYFWIAALLIAAIELPDFLSPIKSLARSVKAQTILLKARAASDPASPPANTSASEN